MRQQLSLAGTWHFQLDPHGSLSLDQLQPDPEIPVPMPWQAVFPDLRQYSGYAWYRRSFDVDPAWLNGEVLLHFGAVDYWCQVFVNEEFVGEHEGGYTPFSLPIRRVLHAGSNDLVVRVYDSAQSGIDIPRWPHHDPRAGAGGPPFDAVHIPHGKQEWYINVGGLWQDVTLTAVPNRYLDVVHVTPDIHTGEARVDIQVAGEMGVNVPLVRIEDGQGGAWEASASAEATPGHYTATVTVPEPRLWDTDAPHLYTVVVTLGDDTLTTRFGFREITTADGKLLLNGHPLYLLAALDQDLYPDTIYTVPSTEYLRDQFEKARQMGLNCLRCHIKPPDPRYLDLADEMGLLVWAEIPSWRTFTHKGTVHPHQLALDEDIHRRVEQTLVEMVRRDYNHPSLIIWTIVNEDWGTALPLSAADRAWVATMYDRCKALDPTRLAVDNSACLHAWGPNVHVKSDLDDFHIYANIPDQARGWQQSLEQFDLRPMWTYSSAGDAQRTGREPLVLSEFGNWGLPRLSDLRRAAGGDPHWFDIGAWWSPWEGEAGWPEGVAERFQGLGLGDIWPNVDAFATATQWRQFEAMRFEIETMRRLSQVQGYVITELTDAYWESNGLLDFYRQPKTYHQAMAAVNSLDFIAAEMDRYAYWDDESFSTCLNVARYGKQSWEDARLEWRMSGSDEGGDYGMPPLEPGDVRLLGVLRQRLPAVEQAQMANLDLRVVRDGHSLARSTVDVLVVPAAARAPSYQDRIWVVGRQTPGVAAAAITPLASSDTPGETTGTPDDMPALDGGDAGPQRNLRAVLQGWGYQTTTEPSLDVRLAVTDYPTAELLEWVRRGGSLLYINLGSSPFFWTSGRGGAYSGNWISSFSWIRPSAHRRLGTVDNPLGLPFMHVMPRRTILGLPVEDRAVQGDFLAGMVSGWVRHPAVHTVQFRYGEGRVLMTTFALKAAPAADPVAAAMLHDLIDHLTSDQCDPTLRANY